MNNYITYCALAKINQLISFTPDVKSIKLTSLNGGFNIDYLFSNQVIDDIIICSTPLVVTDEYTLNFLGNASIDFSYESDEFIIKRIKDVVPSYS